MQTSAVENTITIVTKGEDSAGLALVDKDGKPKKLKLQIRQLEFEVELARQNLPRDTESLLRFALEQRRQRILGKYNLACVWVRLKKDGSEFWKPFGYSSLDGLLVGLELPMGATLARWEVLVNFFDKETFLLAGDNALAYMVHFIRQHQSDKERYLKDFQAIFDAYSAKYASFNKARFREIVHWYVNRHYVKQKGRASENPYSKPKTVFPSDRRSSDLRATNQAFYRQDHGEAQDDLQFYKHSCANCRERDERLKQRDERDEAARLYIVRLEEIIRINLGPKAVPTRPKILEMDLK